VAYRHDEEVARRAMSRPAMRSRSSGVERAAGPLNVVVWGHGERVICIHGSLSWGTFAFRAQRPLAGSRALVLPDRRGYGGSAPGARADFAVDAEDVAALLGDGGHLVGHSYGAVVALLVAARRPEAVRTLTVVEPAALAVARGDPAVEQLIATLEDVDAAAAGLDVAEFVLRFLEALGYRRGADMPERPHLTPESIRAATATMTERPPWEAEIPLEPLPYPVLVVTGDHEPAFDAVADVLVRTLGSERAIVPGAGHAVQFAPGFNDVLLDFVGR
jgi:pimeloyl-ACP methyl ester carboxylesterase